MLLAVPVVAADDPLVAWWRSSTRAIVQRDAAALPEPPSAAGGVARLHYRMVRLWVAASPEQRPAAGGLLVRSQELLCNLVQGFEPAAAPAAVPEAGDPLLLAAALPPERPELAGYIGGLIGSGADEEQRRTAASGLVDLLDTQRRRADLWATQPERAREFYRTEVVDWPITQSQWEEVICLATALHPGRLELKPGSPVSRARLLFRYQVARDCPAVFVPLVGVLTTRTSGRELAEHYLHILGMAEQAAAAPEMGALLPAFTWWAGQRRHQRRVGWTDEVDMVVAVVRLLRDEPERGRAGALRFRELAAAYLATMPVPEPPAPLAEGEVPEEPPMQRVFGWSGVFADLEENRRLVPLLAEWAARMHARGKPLTAWDAEETAAIRADLLAQARSIEPAYPGDPDPSRPWLSGLGYPLCDLFAAQERIAGLPAGDERLPALIAERETASAALMEAHARLVRDLAHHAVIAAAAREPMPVPVVPLHLGLGLPSIVPPTGWSDDRAAADQALRAAAAGSEQAAVIAERLIQARYQGAGPESMRLLWERMERRARLLEGLTSRAAADLDLVRSDLGRAGGTVLIGQLDAARRAALPAAFAAAAGRYLAETARPAAGFLHPRVTMTPALASEVLAARATRLGWHFANLVLWVQEGEDERAQAWRLALVRQALALQPTAAQGALLDAFHVIARDMTHNVAAAFAKAAIDAQRGAFLAALDEWQAVREQRP